MCNICNVRFNGLGKANICESKLKWKFAKWQKGGSYIVVNISKY